MTKIQGRWSSHRRSHWRRVGLAIAWAGTSMFAIGCADEPEDPDNDDRRGRSKLIPIGQVVTDAISPGGFDSVDWKRIETPGEGFLTVNVFWDVPSIDGTFLMSDKYGVTVQEIRRDRRTPSDQIIVRSELQTYFFVKVEAFDGSSVYSLQTSFAETGNGLDGADEPIPELIAFLEPPPVPEEEAAEEKKEEEKEGGGPGLPKGDKPKEKAAAKAPVNTDPVATDDPNKGKPAKIEDLVPDYTGAYDELESQILRVIPKALGGSEVTISAGTNNGVNVDMIGEIIMPDGKRLEGGRFKVTEVYKNTLLAQTNAPANQVSAAAKVIVKIPKEQ